MKNIVTLTTVIFALCAIHLSLKSQNNMSQEVKKVNVWDTYVTKKNGAIMHFDIIAPVAIEDTSIIYGYGKAYLKSKGQEGQVLTSKQCRLCHFEALKASWEKEIQEKGYFIIEMEGCD